MTWNSLAFDRLKAKAKASVVLCIGCSDVASNCKMKPFQIEIVPPFAMQLQQALHQAIAIPIFIFVKSIIVWETLHGAEKFGG